MRQRGYILLLGLLVATGLMTLVTVGLSRSMVELSIAQRDIAYQEAFHVAEAGVDAGVRWLKTQPSPPVCDTAISADPQDGFSAWCELEPFVGPQPVGNGTYTVVVEPDDGNPSTDTELYRVRSTGMVGGVTRTTSLILKSESFSYYQQFLEGDSGVWITGSGANGPVHTNHQFVMYGNPSFYDRASSVATDINCLYGGPCNPHYYGGKAFGQPHIDLPLTSDVSGPMARLINHSEQLDGDTTIEISGNTLLVTNAAKSWINHPLSVDSTPAVFVKSGTLSITGGTLDGKLTLGSDNNIVINGPVRYACDPTISRWDPDCLDGDGKVAYNDDVLGLVAEHNVMVSNAAPTTNMRVDAAVLTVEGKYYFEGYQSTPTRGYSYRLGSFVSKEAGYFWSMDFSTMRCVGGYCSSYWSYDRRLRNLAPPYYPTTGKFNPAMWEEPPNP